ncbi:MAG: hypothetical protein WC548_01000 [Candidatus Pacearchaeota archaeon]
MAKVRRLVVEIVGVSAARDSIEAMRCYGKIGDQTFPTPWYQQYCDPMNPRQFQVIDDGSDAYVVIPGVAPKEFKPSTTGRQSIMKKDAREIMVISPQNQIFSN